MTFEDNQWDFNGVNLESPADAPEVAQAIEDLRSSAAGLAVSTSTVCESMSTFALDLESSGCHSDYLEASAQMESTAVNINESAELARSAGSVDEVGMQTDYIERATQELEDTTHSVEQLVEREPEDAARDHRDVAESLEQVRQSCGYVRAAASSLFGWWTWVTDQRQPVDLTDPEQVAALTDEDRASRGHWRDMANAAPAGSVGSVIAPMAEQIYAVVGETLGHGIGQTFEDGSELFNYVNETPEQTAQSIIDWARYETAALQTNAAMTDAGTRIAGAILSEEDRATILWASFRAQNPELDLPDSVYEFVNEDRPQASRDYERSEPW